MIDNGNTQGNYGLEPVTVPNRYKQKVRMPKNAWVTFWLALFGGWLGANRFYLGHYIFGVVWLLTMGLGGAGWLVDIFIAWHVTRKENIRRGFGAVVR